MGHKYRLYPTKAQEIALEMHCSHARYVWNLALEQANLYRKHRSQPPNAAQRQVQLAEARSCTWLGDGSSSVQQQALRDFDNAMKAWWSGARSRPRWRTKTSSSSFRVRDVRLTFTNAKWAEIFVPKLGKTRFRLSRPLPVEFGMATIKRDRNGWWHVSFTASQPSFERASTGQTVGVDMGVVHSVTLSTGEFLDMPALLSSGELQRRKRLQRKMARQVGGSKRRDATRMELARSHATEARRRLDWIEKATTILVHQFDFIAIEDLKVASMVKSASGTLIHHGVNVAQKKGLNTSIHNQSWGKFRKRLTDKAAASVASCTVSVVRANGTSQQCSSCGHTSRMNRKNQAAFECVSCGSKMNADVNAALNIHAAGLAVAGRGGQHGLPCEASTADSVSLESRGSQDQGLEALLSEREAQVVG